MKRRWRRELSSSSVKLFVSYLRRRGLGRICGADQAVHDRSFRGGVHQEDEEVVDQGAGGVEERRVATHLVGGRVIPQEAIRRCR